MDMNCETVRENCAARRWVGEEICNVVCKERYQEVKKRQIRHGSLKQLIRAQQSEGK
jgi:hypothetical protein